MKTSADIETAIAVRCTALGLERLQAQALVDAGLFPSSLVHVLGLDPATLAPLPAKPWLRMAAQTSSVSYRAVLTPDILLAVLVSGDVSDEFQAHLIHFLNEAPMQLVVMAVEQAAQQSGMPITRIWRSVDQLNSRLQGRRLGSVGESTCVAQIE
jgi:hypothetical protein